MTGQVTQSIVKPFGPISGTFTGGPPTSATIGMSPVSAFIVGVNVWSGTVPVPALAGSGVVDVSLIDNTIPETLRIGSVLLLASQATLTQSEARAGSIISGQLFVFAPTAAYLSLTGTVDENSIVLTGLATGPNTWAATIPPATASNDYAVILVNAQNIPIVAGVIDVDPASAVWRYATQQDVEDLMGIFNLGYASNQEATGANTINTGRILRAGRWADAQIHMALRGIYPIPLDNMGADDAEIIGGIDVDFVLSQLVHWRIIQYAGDDDLKRTALYDRLLNNAQSALDDLAEGKRDLSIPRLVSYAAPQGNEDALDLSGRRINSREFDLIRPYRGYPVMPWLGGFHG